MTGSTIKFYPIDGGRPHEFYGDPPFKALAESFAMDAMPLGWEPDEDTPNDRDFQAECDRYDTIELYHGDDDYIEAVTYDGEVIGTIDKTPLYDISEYETYDQMELREGREDAEREAKWEMDRELRGAAE